MEPGEGTGTTITYYASDDIFETTTYSLETITTRIREIRLPQQGPRDRGPRRAARRPRSWSRPSSDDTVANEVDAVGRRRHPARARAAGSEQVFKYDRGLVDYVEHLNRRKDKANPTVITFEAETVDRRQHT